MAGPDTVIRESFETLMHRARGYREKGESHRSVLAYRKAIETLPDNYTAVHELALLLFQMENLDEAVAVCRAYHARKSDNGEAWNDLGALLSDRGEAKEACDCFEKAVKLVPDNHQYRCNLAAALTDLGEEDEATGFFREVLLNSPGNVRAHYLMGIEFESDAAPAPRRHFDVGQPIVVLRRTFFSNDEADQDWKSRVENITDKTIDIALPTKGWRTLLLRKGTRVIMGFPGQNEFWGVVVDVVGRKYDNIPLATVTNPASFRRVQRRSHVRIPCEGILQEIGHMEKPDGGRVKSLERDRFHEVDISAAGLGLMTTLDLAPGALMTTSLKMENTALTLRARIVRKIPHPKKEFLIGLAFIDIDARMIERLAQFIHRIQLLQRKKEKEKEF